MARSHTILGPRAFQTINITSEQYLVWDIVTTSIGSSWLREWTVRERLFKESIHGMNCRRSGKSLVQGVVLSQLRKGMVHILFMFSLLLTFRLN